eukprot:TRINITY_DN60311_c0_g1_i1.p1 TRINITY_DN60311_c0_g1~~TRINITY_DN60311_c0_g1_i1.p1  ORF type:complete len:327 (+),score=57.40 TRINITY_DN60311_c0_g1_i1:700-1680(+)
MYFPKRFFCCLCLAKSCSACSLPARVTCSSFVPPQISITVDDKWLVLEDVLELPVGSALLSCVDSDDQRQALLTAAQQADEHDALIAQKIIVILRPVSGRLIEAECMVSRCLFGRRQLALALIQDERLPPVDEAALGEFQTDSELLDEEHGPASLRAASEDDASQKHKVRKWCEAARSFGQRCLAPAGRPSPELQQACMSLLAEMDGQEFENISGWSCDSLHDSWEQFWRDVEGALATRSSSSSTGSASEADMELQAQRTFLAIVDVTGVHLWPWLGRSVMVYSRNPFSTFRENGSMTSWTATASTRTVTARAASASAAQSAFAGM